MKNKPSSLYIHIPFCEHICSYCDFPKLQYFTDLAENYLLHLKMELDSLKIAHQLETIYIGGGTPTALEDCLFEKLLQIVAPYTTNIKEYTIEANPESLSSNKIKLMEKYKVTRLSLGVESTDDNILRAINRHHTFADVKRVIKEIKATSHLVVNVDLILGLPQCDKKHFATDLNNIINLGVEHISCYSLTVHPHTIFFLEHVEEPNDDFSRELYDLADKMLSRAGYLHYEVSNWAQPDFLSLHNMTYWQDEEYYGVGLGASGFINKYRYSNTKSITEYNQGHYLASQELISYEDDKIYFIMLTLRTIKGLSFKEYRHRFGDDFFALHQKSIARFVSEDLLIIKEDTLAPTHQGMMVLDQIIVQFISE
ncbi:MAG: radical SAM family heme chaperone HemW [Bacilli bacterium]